MLDWLFPPNCVGCGEPGHLICDICLKSIENLPKHTCQLCANPLHAAGICAYCQNSPPDYDKIYCYAVYSGVVRKAIQRLKYSRDLEMGRLIAKMMAPKLQALFQNANLIVPMPLSLKRFRERGYNQAEAITKPLSELIGWAHSSKALEKIRDTETQVHLSVAERLANLDGAFKADSELVIGKSIVLLDDVMTTGATMRQAAKALREAGAKEIYAATFARTALRTEHTQNRTNL
ncbi:MAG TPA: ComF family protein [Anaerolineaceae bacterium]|nr:ComF family protein [Anaerolineaceae bacterium]